MLDSISRRGISLAESAVGTGKTLAYLVAAVIAKRGRINDFWLRGNLPGQSYAESAHMPVVIATSSIALQRAIATDYIPELSRILMEHDIIQTDELSAELVDLLIDKILLYPGGQIDIHWKIADFNNEIKTREGVKSAG